jgi:uncharacterized heparinase superfamily protein
MAGRSTTFADEGSGLFRSLGDLAMDFKASLTGRGLAPFTGLAPSLPLLVDGNSAIAQRLYRGLFAFAGHTVECQPPQIFAALAPSAGWSDELLGFSWLADLEAPELHLYRAFARNLLENWAAQWRRTSFEASCRRLISLSRHASFLLADASAQFESRFLRLATRETRRLANLRPRGTHDQLRQAIALLTAGLAFRGGGALRNDALSRTAALINLAILPDGGAHDRSPKTLLDLLADLVPLRSTMAAQRVAIPHGLNAAMERSLPMLRMLCHGDDGLAVFHGVEHTSASLVQAILEHDPVQAQPLEHAPQSGYCRMSHGESVVIIDCGAPSICNSTLAFEFSDGPQRIVGSCGVPANASPAWRDAARIAAAHSTLHLEDSSQNVHSRKTRREQLPAAAAELVHSPQGTLTKGRHMIAGIVHAREVFLSAAGHDLRGEDRLEALDSNSGVPNFVIRFHLHPAVKASANRKGAAILLLLPNKDAWQFSARGGAMALEESIYLASASGPRRSWQIVIRGSSDSSGRINWGFKKLERQTRQSEATGASPRLPF